MQIKNLSQLKRALSDRHKFQIIEHKNRPEWIGDIREVNIMQTNAMYTYSVKDQFKSINSLNQGKGSRLDFGKAKDWMFAGGLCTLAGIWTIKVLDERGI